MRARLRRLRPLPAACAVLALAACTSLHDRLAQDCRARGVPDGTPAMTSCIAEGRDAYAAAARQAQGPTGRAYIPPSFQGGGSACFPSPGTGVVC